VIGYALREVFSKREIDLRYNAETLVAITPYEIDGELVRCHELARAVGKVLKLEHEDGRYGFVEHTWLWTEPKMNEKFHAPWFLPNVLDVYVPGGVPQVQLVHMGASGLPPRYYLSNVFDVVIRDDVVEKIITAFKTSKLWPLEGVES